MRHLIDSLDLSVAETQEILDLADRIAPERDFLLKQQC